LRKRAREAIFAGECAFLGEAMVQAWGAALALLSASLWAGQAWAATDDLKTKTRSITVVSAMGDALYFQPENVSMFDFSGAMAHIASRDAKLDDATEAAAAQTLRDDLPGVQIVPYDGPRDVLVDDAGKIFRTDSGAVNALRDDLKAWRAAHHTDLVVLLLPMESRLDDRPSWRLFFNKGVSWNESVVLMHMIVLDGKTGDVLGEAKAHALTPLAFKVTADSFLHAQPDEQAALIGYFRSVLTGIVPRLLRDGGL
jgi:hypothetical protein